MTATAPAALLSQQIRAGKPVFAAWCGYPEPAIAEQLCRDGFDTAVLDMQHGAFELDSAIRGIAHVALAGKPAIVRIPVGAFATVSRIFDYGAAGVIAPMINSAADARAFASFAKLPPVGDRSWGPRRALPLTGLAPDEYLRAANDQHLAIAMIETREAIAALDDILATPGIDGVFVGPSDLSIALSHGQKVDWAAPEVDQALDHVAARAKVHGKFCSAFTFNGVVAKNLASRGFSLLSIGTDALLMKQAAAAELQVARLT
ncbi:HpcH/HpaI aldolase family protein [Methylovirgula sp. 4M-Z18]|uniref:HpcH/HpaI aldolase family protein n=1 Tax=Methylovirgula sp. 4M-Z18 TaxID=2293567 RepID=UPI000E2F7346|nr:aldolase/citrate lyase family protein [Methylovirgula sp. 4M-Z18]RFB77963.1 hydroxyacid aldolase [Methylovirgula sp. 4M-Z18]